MKKVILIAVVGSILILIFSYAYTQETITLSTYYPAPYGEYRKLAIGSSAGGYTAPSSPDIDLVVEGNVGIGTTSPVGKLHVNSVEILGNSTDDDGDGLTDEYEDVIFTMNGNVGIGTASPGTILDLDVSNRADADKTGFLPPRMTQAQLDTIEGAAAEGSVAYNTTDKELNCHDGTSWKPVGGVKTWDSGWFYVTTSTKYYERNHTLGKEPLIVQLWYSRQSDGSGEKVLGSSIYSQVGWGLKIYDYDSTKITVTTGGGDYLNKFRDKNGTYIYNTTGYARIVALTD